VILVDTSVWIDHLRSGDARLAALLESGQVLTHPFVIGEIAMGSLRRRDTVLSLLTELPSTTVASDLEVLRLIEGRGLYGRGLGYVDAHLLAAALLTSGTSIWTRDNALDSCARQLGVAAST
jgi:predicted nucleic acid-binding protein